LPETQLAGFPTLIALFVKMMCEIFATLGKSFHPVILQRRFPVPLSRSYNRWRRGMTRDSFIDDPQHWRARAEEARIVANQLSDSEAKAGMLRIAEDYERLAQWVEDWALRRLRKH
jgi:hypothetical protein